MALRSRNHTLRSEAIESRNVLFDGTGPLMKHPWVWWRGGKALVTRAGPFLGHPSWRPRQAGWESLPPALEPQDARSPTRFSCRDLPRLSPPCAFIREAEGSPTIFLAASEHVYSTGMQTRMAYIDPGRQLRAVDQANR